MALLSEKTELDKLFTKATGITYTISDLIAACSTDEEKAALYKKLSWKLKRGEVLDNEGVYQQQFAKLVPALAEACGIDVDADDSVDMDKDGDVDVEDARIKKDIDKASSIVIETSSSDSNDSNSASGLDID